MTTWQEGKTYDYYGRPVLCARRYFDGCMEMVELRLPMSKDAALRARTERDSRVAHLPRSGDEPWDHCAWFVRCAMTLAPCVKPQVTDTLGGIFRADACEHEPRMRRFVSDAGPNKGHLCCSACGGRVP